MQEIHLTVVYHHPIEFISLFSVFMAIVSLWIRKTAWIWGSFGLISLCAGLESGLIDAISLVPITFFSLLIWGLQFDLNGLGRFLIFCCAFLIGAGLYYQIFPGFHTKDVLPFPFCFSISKAFVGLALIGWAVPTLSLTQKNTIDLKLPSIYVVLGAASLSIIIFLLSQSSPRLDLSAKNIIWAISYLFFTLIPEEALLRGLLQHELTMKFESGAKKQIIPVFIVTGIYPLFHLSWAGDFTLFIPILLSGLVYAVIYQATKLIEASLLCHFSVATIHCLFFHHLPLFNSLPCLNFGL